MGLSNSRLRSRSSRSRVNRSSSLSYILLCGASSSRASIKMEEDCENIHEFQNPRLELSSGPNAGLGSNLGNCFEGGLRSIGTSNTGAYSRERNKERVSDDFGNDESSRGSNNHRASSSSSLFKDRQSFDAVSLDVSANVNAVNGIDDSVRNGASSSSSDAVPIENHTAEEIPVGSFGSDSRSSAQISGPQVSFNPFGSEPLEDVVPSGLGFLVSNRERARADGSVLQVDVLSISSNVLSNSSAEGNNREARRNGRRMFWDAFSRRSSRRLLDSPTFVFSMDENEDVGSRDGWVFGLSGDFFDDVNGSDSGYLGSSRIHYSTDRRRHSRSEVLERLRSGFDESGRRNTFCPSGIHPDGSCSCESLFMNEESSTRASISRIVMLAEALFEVLDEIHRQPVSLSLSMVSSPAPASVVDSFPLKSHSKIDKGKSSEDVVECYICLAEYEEGDKIRVLPCHHEYHMSCVDKWLKEIHGVCPLCRGDVREGLTECSVSNSEIPSV